MEMEVYKFLKSLTSQQQKQVVDRISMFVLATNINKDPDFISEAEEDLKKEFPVIGEYIEKKKHEHV